MKAFSKVLGRLGMIAAPARGLRKHPLDCRRARRLSCRVQRLEQLEERTLLSIGGPAAEQSLPWPPADPVASFGARDEFDYSRLPLAEAQAVIEAPIVIGDDSSPELPELVPGVVYSDMSEGTGWYAWTGDVTGQVGYEDYDSINDANILLQEMRFIGGVQDVNDQMYFYFYSDRAMTNYVGGFSITFDTAGYYIWTLTLGSGITIPDSGVLEIFCPSGSEGNWFFTDAGPTIGTNDGSYGSASTYGMSHKFELSNTEVTGNDDFADRIDLGSVASVTDTGSNVGYTGETGEPAQSGDINSAWWKWTAPSNGALTVDTNGSGFDTYLTLATGSAVDALTVLDQDDDGGSGVQSLITWDVTSGVEYQIAVDGYSSDTGAITLNLSLVLQPGAISGKKWNDVDGDGVVGETGESGLQDWTIYVDANRNGQWDGATAEPLYDVTGADGTYSIDNVPPGTYWVGEVQQTGWEQTYPVSDQDIYTYDNGPLVNSPGTGVGGADESVLQSASLGMTTLGVNHSVAGNWRVADDFTVTDSGGVDLNTITLYAYQTGSSTSSTIDAVNYRIWNGLPEDPGSTVVFGDTATNRLISSTWSGIYRVSETTSGSATDRPIMASTVSAGVHLPPGTYWLDWQTGGSLTSGPWVPPITINGQTTTGDGRQRNPNTGFWLPVEDAGTLAQQGLPFILHGVVTASSQPSASEVAFAVVDSPPTPPSDTSYTVVDVLPPAAVTLSEVPTSTWTFGCTATSAGMIFGYYDRHAYPNMYTGPANGGVAPLTNLGQGIPGDTGYPLAGACSIIATDNGFDGRVTDGHVEDYWIGYLASGPDPWEAGGVEHTWGDCTADYLGTNQWKWDYDLNGSKDTNVDGSTVYFYNTDGSKLYDFIPSAAYGTPQTEACHGMRLFAESRGYDVAENYTQLTNNVVSAGFTFNDYMAEIDNQYPVMLHVEGHTMVGVGYDTTGNIVYLHDTWDNNVHTMTWGGSYSGMGMLAVTVIHLDPVSTVPPGFWEVDVAAGQTVTDIDFGNFSDDSGTIEGVKWNDVDGDGIVGETGESGLQGWTIYVDANQNGQWDGATAEPLYDETGADGTYSIDNVPPGTHWVGEVQQPGWEQTYPNGGAGGGSFRLLAGTGSEGTNPFSLVELQTDPVAEVLIGASAYHPGLDVDPTTGLLYGASSSLRIVNSTNGSYTTVGSIDSATETGILTSSIAFAPDGTLYGVSSADQKLYTINKSTAFATEVGTIPASVWGIDFAPDGTLYGAFSSLVILDPATGGLLSTVGSLGATVLDIDYAPDGMIYGVYYDSMTLYEIDPSDASTASVGVYDSEIWGVASELLAGPSAPTPMGVGSAFDLAAAIEAEEALKALLPPAPEVAFAVVDSPPTPPSDTSYTVVDVLPPAAVTLSEVPTSTWTFGCTATSAGMIFGYYDRGAYPDMYTGPANGGVAPLVNLGQGIPGDAGYPLAGACSIIATDNGFDGRVTDGHVEDYWIGYLQPGPDPWESGGGEHTWGDCTADYLGTNQWKWDYDLNGSKDTNVDGSTVYFFNTDGSKLYDFIPSAAYGTPQTEACHGMRLFAESRGYDVAENYTQLTNNVAPAGFDFYDYMAEIDNGYPVMLHVEGHTMVGVGYDTTGNTVYLHDTWDNLVHTMTWGGSYSGMQMLAVTVVHLDPPTSLPPGFWEVDVAAGQTVTDVDFGNFEEERWDFGDAPDTGQGTSAGNYQTLLVDNGARHVIDGPWLGPDNDNPDAETDGQPHPSALGDDTDANYDDEDGVAIPPLYRGLTDQITVMVSGGGGHLTAWIDFTADGDWIDFGEQIFSGPLADGVHQINVTTPIGATLGQTFARFRITTTGPTSPDGPALDGEVEDYEVEINDPGTIEGFKYYDADGDGVVGEPGEPGLEGWRVYVDVNLNGQWDPGEPYDDTGPDGSYSISGLRGGTHVLAEVPQDGWQQTYPAGGGGGGGAGSGSGVTAPTTQQLIEWMDAPSVPTETPELLEIDTSWVDGPGPSALRNLDMSSLDQAAAAGVPLPGSGVYHVYVESGLLSSIQASIDAYVADLTGEGYTVTYGEFSGDAAALRSDLQTKYTGTNLEGALFVGDLPYVDFESEDNYYSPVHVTYPHDLYFMDLDGTYVLNPPGTLDEHTAGSGDVGPEIYVSRITTGNLSGVITGKTEAQLINEYFTKVHDYRTGVLNYQNRGIVFADDDWDSWGVAEMDDLYFDVLPINTDPATIKANYLSLLGLNRESILECIHSSATYHAIKVGSTSEYVTNAEVQAVNPRQGFYNMFNCSGAEFSTADHLIGTYVYGGDYGLNAVGSTKTGSMLFFDDYYQPQGTGENVGEAFRQWFDKYAFATNDPPNDTWVDWFYGMTMQGDPTLKPDSMGDIPGTHVVDLNPGETKPDIDFGNESTMDFGDAPDPTYPTLLPNGARHIVGGPWLGDANDAPDTDPDGQPSSTATGDDFFDGNDDEDGVKIPSLIAGQTATITVEVSNEPGVVQGWIDFNGDGTWQAAEKVFDGLLPVGVHTIPVTAPAGAAVWQTYARFRISRAGNLGPDGPAPDGEVEDYLVFVLPENTKWDQLPDVTRNGIDVRMDDTDGINRVLADDFQCTEPSLLTDVHFWASHWLDEPVDVAKIHLSVHKDDRSGPYSKPGELLWEMDFLPGQFRAEMVTALDEPEWWWDPWSGELIWPGDSQLWRYDIQIDPARAFFQQGSTTERVIYWLDIQVDTIQGQVGWKTRQWPDHFEDDAVWAGPEGWQELVYPAGHPYADSAQPSIDLAYVLTFESALDWGDAPDPAAGTAPGDYETLLRDNGPRHVIVSNLLMGAAIDPEPDAQPTPAADGDDLNGATPDDEDGLVDPAGDLSLVEGVAPSVDVKVTNNTGVDAKLYGWIDYDGDGVFEASESASKDVPTGSTDLTVTLDFLAVPAGSAANTYARFRLSTDTAAAQPTGAAADGEVEDYTVEIDKAPQVTNVWVRGSDWTQTFLDYLQSSGQGHATYGYAIPVGPGLEDQLDILPWVNIDTIAIELSEDVTVVQGDLQLWGVNVVAYTFSGFSYAGNVAAWTLSSDIGPDKLRIDLDGDPGGVADTAGNLLDGEWTDQISTYPSGNGIPGGDFRFRFNVVPGDADQDGETRTPDWRLVRTHGGEVPGDPDYSKFLDINGDGRINTPDWRISRAEGGNRLPPGEPGPAGPSPLASATGVMANDLVLAGPLDPAPVRLDSMASRTGLSAWDEALLMVAAEDLDRADDKEEAASELLPALFFDFGQE